MSRDPSIRALTRGLQLLEAFAGGNAMSQSDVSRSTGIPYPTCRRILMTLLESGHIEQLPVSGRYALTDRTLALSAGFQDRQHLVRRFRAGMDRLCRSVGWPISLVVPVGSRMVVRYSTHNTTTQTFTVYQPGFATPLAYSAAGIAYLSALPVDRREALIAGLDIPAMDTEQLRGSIVRAYQRRIAAYERTKYNPTPGKLTTIAVPVIVDDAVTGALALTFFAAAMPLAEAEQRYAALLAALATSGAQHEAEGSPGEA